MVNNPKIRLINGYIERCEKELKIANEKLSKGTFDSIECEKLFKEIDALFYREINGFSDGLLLYTASRQNFDFIKDLNTALQKLKNYRADLESKELSEERELEKLRLQAEIQKSVTNINNQNNNNNDNNSTANASTNMNITISQTLDNINKLPKNILSSEDREHLKDLLDLLEAEKNRDNKAGVKNKLGKILGFIADKAVDVGIAVLPYLSGVAKFLGDISI